MNTPFASAVFALSVLALSVPALADPAPTTQAAGPRLEFVQMIKYGDESIPLGKGINGIKFKGDYVYVCAGAPAVITWFKRDPQSGQLSYAGNVAAGQRLAEALPTHKWPGSIPKGPACILAMAGGKLYAISTVGPSMLWYDLDSKTGQPTEKGMVDCPAAWQVVVGPDEKDLYVKNWDRAKVDGKGVNSSLVWFKLDANGEPSKMGEVAGKGLGVGGQIPYYSLLQMSPDGKYIYGTSCNDMAIAIIERKPDGAIAYKQAVDLTVADAKPKYFHWASLAITPDGKHVYASLWGYGKAAENLYRLFDRDADTGELKLKETINGEKLSAVLKGWDVYFLPDGTGGYWSSTLGPAAFTRDAATGHLEQTTVLKETRGQRQCMCVDPEHGFLYAGSRAWDGASGNLFVLRIEKVASH